MNEGDGSSFAVFAAFSPDECTDFQQMRLRIRLKEEDPLMDDTFGIQGIPLLFDCSLVSQVAASGNWPRFLPFGVIPDIDLPFAFPDCEDEGGPQPLPLTLFAPSVCLGDSGLLGSFTFFEQRTTETDATASMFWRARVGIYAR